MRAMHVAPHCRLFWEHYSLQGILQGTLTTTVLSALMLAKSNKCTEHSTCTPIRTTRWLPHTPSMSPSTVHKVIFRPK